MLETVGIVLNERESSKAEIAAQLEQVLTSKGITTFRYPIESQIKETLYQKRPPVLILDYILGDYSTGLDVLEQFHDLPDAERPDIFFLTDEPSASVATTAMRGGAKHFLNIQNSHSVPVLISEIEKLRNAKIKIPFQIPSYERMDDLIFESDAMRKVQSKMHVAIAQKLTFPIFVGGPGSGKNTLAKAYFQELGIHPPSLREIDMRFCLEDIDELLTVESEGKTLLFTHLEADDGELLEALNAQKEVFKSLSPNILIMATTSEQETARAWESMLGGETILIPELKEREQDFSPLIQKFSREAAKLFDTKITPPAASIIDKMSKMNWTRGIDQLREVLLSSLHASQKSEKKLADILEEQFAYSELYTANQSTTQEPQKPLLQSMLEEHRYRYRVVAAKLGISCADITRILHDGGTG